MNKMACLAFIGLLTGGRSSLGSFGGAPWRGECHYPDLLCYSWREQIALASTLGGVSYPWREALRLESNEPEAMNQGSNLLT